MTPCDSVAAYCDSVFAHFDSAYTALQARIEADCAPEPFSWFKAALPAIMYLLGLWGGYLLGRRAR